MSLASTHSGSHLPRLRKLTLVATFVILCLVIGTGGVGGQSVEDDHGNTFPTATDLSLDSSVEGRIDPSNDFDMFELDLSDAEGSTTVAIYTTGDLDTLGRLYESDGAFLASDDDHEDLNFLIVETLESGTYYIAVHSYSDRYVGDYTLHAEEVPPDDHGNSIDGATPLALGSAVTGSIDPDYDLDMFKLDLSDASEPTDVWIYTSGELYTAGGLYDSEGSLIPGNAFYDGRNINIVQTLTSGIYYVSVESRYNSEVGEFTIHAEEAPADDHADTTDEATPIDLGSSLTGRIFPPREVDLFELDLSDESGPKTVRIYSTGENSTMGTLYDSDGSTIASNAYYYDDNFQIVETLQSEAYYISVEGYYYSETGDYTLHVEEVPPDDHANSTDGATSLALGSSVTGRIDPEYDIDMFKLDLSAETEPTTVRLYSSGDLDTFGELYDSDGTRLQINHYYDDDNFQIVDTLPSGIYYVAVATNSYYRSRTGDYTLHAEEVPPDDHANTSDGATALGLGDSETGSIDPGFDKDFFKLDLSDAVGSTNVTIYTTGDLDTYGQLYDSDDERITYSHGISFGDNYDDNLHLRANLPSGVYYVEVRSSYRSTGDYVLRAETVPDQGDSTESATDLSLDTLTPGSIVSSEDADYFKLDLSEQKSLIVRASSLDYERLEVTAFDSEGNEVSVNTFPYGYYYIYGFRIEDDFGRDASYLKLTSRDSSDERPVHYNIHAVEDVEYTEYVEECEAATRSLNIEEISDSLYACQWHQNSNHEGHINVESVWEEGIKGEGVNVAVVDDGLYYDHEDLKDNVDTSLNHDYTGSGDVYGPYHHHGTHVTGLIAARDNDVGVRGVAPRATIYGYNLLAYFSDLNAADAMARNREITAVSSHSWGRRGYPYLVTLPTVWKLAIDAGIAEGYHGKGTFYAFAAGNGHFGGDNSNFSELTNYYGVTAVCAVNDHDVRSDFSEMGANLWVCAPSNDSSEQHRGILTTENSDRYYEEFGGTSAATPIVSGVVALLRGVNSDLTWRDLKLILAASARKNDIENTGWEDGASKYGMGSDTEVYHFNHEYGFGVVDAAAAVDLAEDWSLVPPLQSSTVESEELNLEIPNPPDDGGDPTTITTALTLDTSIGFVEYVEVNFEFELSSIRNWDVELVSPSGAISELVPGYASYGYYSSDEASNEASDVVPSHYYPPPPTEFRFGSAKHLGEDPSGEWQLRITDRSWYGTGTLGSWSLTVYGHERTPGPPLVDWVTPDSDSLTVSWTAPGPTGGLSSSDYDVRYIRTDADDTVEANWTVLEDVWNASTGGDLEYTVTGLLNGVRYDLQVRAVNSAGKGDWSRSFTATVTRSLCSTAGAVADAASNPGLVSDCEALLAGQDTLEGSGALNWTADTLITDWDGITSLENQRVTRLYLQEKELNGSLPIELGSLSSLEWLYLHDNDLSGEIPSELGRLTKLQRLFLYDNELGGPVPGELGDIEALEFLAMYGNDLSGEIPAKLGDAPNLERLLLQDNELSGEIPGELGTPKSLTHLIINNNSLTGEIPHELGNLPNLEWLYLSGNSLTGCIPEQLRLVDHNDFGELVNAICDFDALVALYDAAGGADWTNSENWMTDSPLGEWYGVTTDEMGRVSVLDLRSNELSGEIPAELGGLDKLESLELQINELSGEIPAELGNLTSLSRLVLHTNKLTGEIPGELGDLTNLSMMRLDENMLTGGIPTELSNLSFLTDLELWKNNLTGEIPAELGNLFNLSFLTLWGNQLTGEIPEELGRLANLRWLWLHDNQLSGEIPSELGNIFFLYRLDLSMNDLTGEIPSEFGDLDNLSSLNLSQNRLTGTIVVELGDFNNLSELDLSQNQLTGEIPTEFSTFRYMRVLDLAENDLTGEIPAELGTFRYLQLLDLAQNDLTGEIPDELSTLQYLRELYLSGNHLTGCVPTELREVIENDFEHTGLPYCDVLLSALTISPRSLTPTFDPHVTSYNAIEGSSGVTVAPVNEHDATFRVLDQDGNELADLDDSQDGLQINLDADTITIRVVVTSQDGQATHTYSIRVAPLAAPGAPFIDFVAQDIDGLTVVWVPPLDSGGAGIESYDVRYIKTVADETVESNWTVVEEAWTASSDEGLKYAITELTGGSSYDVQVRATNSVGTGPWSETRTGTPIESSVCLSGGAVTDRDNRGLVNDCETMLAGRDTLAGTGSLNWSAETPIAEWDGIIVQGDLPSLEGTPIRVTRLYLQERELNGTITAELANLDKLKWLFLHGNDLTGEIPTELAGLANLERLYLNGNELTGVIPKEMGNLAMLERLYLHGNDLTGDIPPELGKLSKLTHLNLLDNNLGGNIPPEFGDLSNLVWLALYGNMLGGEIPSELGGLTNLERLYLHRNYLIGEIPPELGDLTSLTNLWLSNNELEGEIPTELENLTTLVRLRLSGGNVFAGCVPKKLADVESHDLDQLSIPVCSDS